MTTKKLWTIILAAALFGFGTTLWNASAQTEKIPELRAVPPDLPAQARERLSKQTQELEREFKAFMADARAFNAKRTEDQTDAEFAALQARRVRYITTARAFNEAVIEAQESAALSSDPMVVDLRGRLRDSVNLAVVNGGLPPASQAGGLTFMPAGGAAAPPYPKLQGVSQQMAANPRNQDSHAEMSAGQLRGVKALAGKGRADGMEAFNGILDQTLNNLINDALKKPGQTTAPAGMEKLEKALDKAWEEMINDMLIKEGKKGQVDELRARIHKQTGAALLAAQNRFFDQLGADVKDIKKRGLVGEKDNFIEKMDTDMRVRQAVDKAILDGFFQLMEDCGSAYAKSVDDFATEMKRLVDQPNAKSTIALNNNIGTYWR